MSNAIQIALSGVLVVVVVGIAMYLWIPSDPESLAFRECFSSLAKLERVDELDVRLFQEHKLYVLSASVLGRRPPGYCVAAVGEDGKAFALPEKFNDVVLRERIFIPNETSAYLVAETYIWLASIPSQVIILYDSSQIPKGGGKDPDQFASVITAPTISAQIEGYSVTFYIWKNLNGRLERWSFQIGTNGLLDVNSTRIASLVGKPIGLA